ncbi:hypothetical protein DM02DRAFT_628406 [Periconia macrospinosa]|uniref:Cell surface protein n=1 Tax=Periconia macrospinosa TaxID=97972 RepID=A0A2V1DRC6_9PLEO|nr:hypothetical protein DM02DRAFT_628406 [Periconia macrospinosa]
MKFSTIAASTLLAVTQAAALPAPPPGTPAFPSGLKAGESCTTTSTAGVLGCDDGTGGTFNIVNGRRESKRDSLEDGAVTADQAVKQFNNLEPGTPVIDGKLNLREGESCTTTSTKGVLGCQDGTGGTFNIVNGRRQSKRALEDGAVTAAQAVQQFDRLEPGTPVIDGSLKLKPGQSCTTTSTKGVLGCQDGTGATFNIVNGRKQSKRDMVGRRAVTAAQAAKDKNLEPGTRVVDASLDLNDGETCTTTSTLGVLACSDPSGASFNIVNGERQSL